MPKQYIIPLRIFLALGCIVALSVWANIQNNGFPLGYHLDEPNKVRQIVRGEYVLQHPALMIHAGRLANFFVGHDDPQRVVELGRTISALFAAGIAFSTFWLVRFVAGPARALLVALAVAVSPIIVVHAHYLKEDVYVALFMVLALLSLVRLLDSPRRSRLVELGVVTGLAVSSKLTALALFPYYLLVPFVCRVDDRRTYFKGVGVVTAISLVTFTMVNYPIFFDVGKFFDATGSTLRHNLAGQELDVYPLQFAFTFHFVKSVVPGITPAMAYAGLFGMLLTRVKGLGLSEPEKALLLFAGLFYLIIETSPGKAFPDFMRYAIPLVPVVLYFAVRAMFDLSRLVAEKRRALPWVLFALCVIWPAYESFMYTRYMEDDTRAVWRDRVARLPVGGRVLAESYVEPKSGTFRAALSEERLVELNLQFLAVSSFMYDRYQLGSKLWWQDEEVDIVARRYAALFTCPYVEIKPAFRSFAASNPTIRVIFIQQCPKDMVYP